MVVPHCQLGYGMNDRLEGSDIALATPFFGQNLGIEGVAINIIADPEKQVGLKPQNRCPNVLFAVELVTRAGAKRDAKTSLLPLRRGGFCIKWRQVALVSGGSTLDPEPIINNEYQVLNHVASISKRNPLPWWRKAPAYSTG